MMTKDFTAMMKGLAACKISPEQWAAWWVENESSVQEWLNDGEFLRLKPIRHGFRYVPILKSQKEAVAYLEKNGIPFERNDDYQANYRKELDDYCKAEQEKETARLNALKERIPALFAVYPRFCNSLKNAFSAGDQIESGVTDEDMSTAPCAIPADIAAFFKVVSVISLDGISVDFHALRTETLCGKAYLVLGEFWKEADGDLLLIKPCDADLPTPIYYYGHAVNKVKKLCNSIDDLIEKKFSWYNNHKR